MDSSTPDMDDNKKEQKLRSGRALRRSSPSLPPSSTPSDDKTTEEQQPSSTMGDKDNSNDDRDNDENDNDKQDAITPYTQQQLATLVKHAVNQVHEQAENKARTQRLELEERMRMMERFHLQEVQDIRTDFERMAQQPIADTTPQKTSFYTPHTKRQQDVDYEELTKAAQDNYNQGKPKNANVNFQENGNIPEGTQNFGPGNSSDSKTTPDDDFTAQ
jgi:hypothetical protein